MSDEKEDGRPTYNGYFAEDIIRFCKAKDAENSVITEKKNALVNLYCQIQRWDLGVDSFVMNPKDFDEDLLDLKSIQNKAPSDKGFSTPIYTDPYIPRGVVIAVGKEKREKNNVVISRQFAIADFPQKFSTYLHLFNSGITFSVCDRGNGPQIEINQATFGNLQCNLTTLTNTDSLRKIGEMFIEASQQEYSKEYIHLAKDISDEEWSYDSKELSDSN